MKAVQFNNHTKDSDWETLVQRRMIARLYAFLKHIVGDNAWESYTGQFAKGLLFEYG
jgi:hypothetical protein